MNSRPNEASVIAGVKQSIAWADRLAWGALLFTLSAALANVSERGVVALVGIELHILGAIVGMVAITIAHLFVLRHIIRSCADAWIYLTIEKRNTLFDDIVRTGGLMTKGANSYRNAITESNNQLNLKTDFADPPTWIHFGLTIFTLIAIVDMELSIVNLFNFFLRSDNYRLQLENWRKLASVPR